MSLENELRGIPLIAKCAMSGAPNIRRELQPFDPQLIVDALPLSYHPRVRAVNQHFGRAATRVVIRSQHRAVRADVQNGQQIALADPGKFSVAREKVAGFADGSDYIGNLRLARFATHR